MDGGAWAAPVAARAVDGEGDLNDGGGSGGRGSGGDGHGRRVRWGSNGCGHGQEEGVMEVKA